jgi:hypothetical protein
MHNDIARAADALHAIPPDLPQDGWMKAGMAYKAADGDSETFYIWRAQAANYNAADCPTAWKSFKKDGGIGAGTLYQMAREHGWTEGKASQALGRRIERPRKRAFADLAVVVPAGSLVFLDTLNRAAPTADENSSKGMGESLSAAKELQSRVRRLVVLEGLV